MGGRAAEGGGLRLHARLPQVSEGPRNYTNCSRAHCWKDRVVHTVLYCKNV